MDTCNNILNNQIAHQINGSFIINCGYTDIEKEYFQLSLKESGLYIAPAFMNFKLLTDELANELIAKIGINVNDQVRDIDFDSGEKYDDFWNRFYNNLPKLI